MDTDALNPEPFAEVSDNSCLYEYKVGFYISAYESDSLMELGCNYYHLFINGQYVGADSSDNFVPSPGYKHIVWHDTLGTPEHYSEIKITNENFEVLRVYTDRLPHDLKYSKLDFVN